MRFGTIALIASALAGCAASPATIRTGDPLAAPRPVFPPATARLGTHRTTLLWLLAPGGDGAQVELCRDAACAQPIERIDADGTRLSLPHDLPLGPIWWRLRGRAHGAVGTRASETRKLLVDVRVTLTGRHLQLTLPEDERTVGEQLLALGDRVVEQMAALLDVAVPPAPFEVNLLSTYQGMAATAENGGSKGHSLLGLSDGRGGPINMLMPPLSQRVTALPPGDGPAQLTLVHELSHSLRRRTLSSDRYQPVWMVEGLADRLAEQQLVGDDHAIGLFSAGRLRTARAALGTRRFIPLPKLLALDYAELNASDQAMFSLLYAESYALVRFLDQGERRAGFRALLRELKQLPNAFAATHLSRRLRALYGDLDALDGAWQAWLRAEPLPPWEPRHADGAQLTPDGVLAVASARSVRSSVATADEEALPLRLHGLVEGAAGKQLELSVWERDGERQLHVTLPLDGTTSLDEWPKGAIHWQVRARGGALTIDGGRHELVLELAVDHLRATVDGVQVIDAAIAPLLAPRVRVGVGVYDGEARFRDLVLERR
jgi:hypothetical protein